MVVVALTLVMQLSDPFGEFVRFLDRRMAAVDQVSFDFRWDSPSDGSDLHGYLRREGRQLEIKYVYDQPHRLNPIFNNRLYFSCLGRWHVQYRSLVTDVVEEVHIKDSDPKLFGECNPLLAFGYFANFDRDLSMPKLLSTARTHETREFDGLGLRCFRCTVEFWRSRRLNLS